MNYKFLRAFSPVVCLCFCFAQCKKSSLATEDQLPPATQKGANTFGCKINGHVFVPKGYSGTGTPNPHLIFDIGLNNLPYLQIDATQYDSNDAYLGQSLISFGSIIGTGLYRYPNKFEFSIGWPSFIRDCGIVAFDSSVKKWGGGEITKYDLTNGIISGTFNFKYKTLTCDTVFVTDGRFDYKL